LLLKHPLETGLGHYLDEDQESDQDPENEFVDPWIPFPVEEVGKDKAGWKCDKDQCRRIESADQGKKDQAGNKHVKQDLVDVLHHCFPNLETVNYVDTTH